MDIRVERTRAEHAGVSFAVRDGDLVLTVRGEITDAQYREALAVARGMARLLDPQAKDAADGDGPPTPLSPRPRGWTLTVALAGMAASIAAVVLGGSMRHTAPSGHTNAAPVPLPVAPPTVSAPPVGAPGWPAVGRATARAAFVVAGATSTVDETPTTTTAPEASTAPPSSSARPRSGRPCGLLCVVVRHVP